MCSYAYTMCMNSRLKSSSILESLERTEREILENLVRAAQNGDYEAIDFAREAAAKIRALITECSTSLKTNDRRPSERQPTPRVRKKQSRDVSRSRKKEAYPKFFTRGGYLYKEGWSRTEKKPFLHKLSQKTYTAVVKALSDLAGSTTPVRTDTILEHRELYSGDPIPQYQVYIVIAFLQQSGAIKRIGREGVLIPSEIRDNATEVWTELAQTGAGENV